MKNKIEICYLCGKILNDAEAVSDDDHVPPRQFFPSSIRKDANLKLFTLPTHASCNKSYQKDEDYFVNSLGPLAMNSYAGKEIWKDISKQIHRKNSKGLVMKILNEFEKRPSGIILPHGMVGKRYNRNRIERVVWKITRGLFFNEHSQFIPENINKIIWISAYGDGLSPLFPYVRDTPTRGNYPGVFDYKYIKVGNYNLWALLFWNTITAEILFQYLDFSLTN
jgi:hypothetical protein